jgi:hypothetical protein
MSTSLDKLNAKIFSEQLHTQFKIHLGGADPMTLELVEVKESDPSPQIELFSLHFRGPSTPRLAQQIHRLEHDTLGTFEIFLTAIGADAQGIVYESVFHRFRKTGPPSSP